MKNLLLRMTPEQHADLSGRAASEGRSMTDYILVRLGLRPKAESRRRKRKQPPQLPPSEDNDGAEEGGILPATAEDPPAETN